MSTNADKIKTWRDAHPGDRLTASTVCDLIGAANLLSADLRGADLRDANLLGANLWGANLGSADLRGADLRGADLWGANLGSADLRGADLRGADLRDADLRGAGLRGADLRDATLRGAILWGADLRGASLRGGLRIDGLPSGQVTLIPTPDGWDLRVGCWHGTPDDLRDLIATDTGWPEATGAEIARRRPLLAAALTLIDAHAADRAHLIANLAERWADR